MNQQPTGNNNNEVIQCYLEEHRTLRNEESQHRTFMHYLTLFNLTASASIFVYAFSNLCKNGSLLFIIPILSSILCFIFLYHNIRTYRIRHYIRHVLAPKLKLLIKNTPVLKWEEYNKRKDKKCFLIKWLSGDNTRPVIYVIINTLILSAAPTSLGIGISPNWWVGLGLTIFLLILLYLTDKEEKLI
jgi:hypothetical protein